jgi:hypothetical protein
MGGHQSKSVTKEVHIDEKELDKTSNVYVIAPDEPFQNKRDETNYYNIQCNTNIIIIFFLILFIILSFYLMCFKIIYK